jgi:uncharacterized membrane protein (DUF4010 family)
VSEQLWQQIGVALGLGLLVGLQRERSKHYGAGIRTFPLITVLGTVCAHLTKDLGGWTVTGGLLAVGALMVLVYLNRGASQDHPSGLTTSIAALLMYAVGAMLVVGETAVSIAVGGGVAVLLHWKRPMHRFVERIGDTDIRAVFRLALIALVILPVLPDRSYGPYDVLNPFRIWLMVVLIVGISLVGYVLSRLFGERAGSVAGGVLGGLISSTATTASYARRSRGESGAAGLAATVIIIASTVVFVRVAFEVAVVSPSVLPNVLPQFGVLAGWMVLVSGGGYLLVRGKETAMPPAKNPSNLQAAVVFGALYAAVLFGVAAAREHFGDGGLYVVAALSGLTDMDAITLSTAQMMVSGDVGLDTGWRMMLVGFLANLVFKGAMVALLGSAPLFRRVAVLFGLSFAGGVLLVWLWPAAGG